MTRLRRIFALPLLLKELTESAARPRTYVVRVLFAVGLYGLVALFLPRDFWRTDATVSFATLGMGRSIFDLLAATQAVGIALFLPAMMCGCITQEKERDSLVLLLLTELRPWQILLQKYLGGLVPVLSFVLLGGPLLAVAYALGGVQGRQILEQSLGVVLLALQLGALTLLCSVWCRTTVAALLSSYLLGALLYVALPLLYLTFRKYNSNREWLASLFPPPVLLWTTSGDPVRDRVFALIPSLLSIFLFLGLARFFFLRRAFLPPTQFLRRVFRRLDAFMQRANRLTGGIVLLRERSQLPGDAPIFWRETRTRALGRPHYLLRILVIAEGFTVLLCLLLALQMNRGHGELLALLGGLALLVVAVQSANVIVSERVNQTLEVLLTTPLAAAQIVREKERALFRLLLVLAMPLLTVVAVEYYLSYDSGLPSYGRYGHLRDGRQLSFLYLVASVLAVAIYLPMVAWLAMTIGLWMRTRFRAITVTLVMLVAWCAFPLLVADQFEIRSTEDLARVGEVVTVAGGLPQWQAPPTTQLVRLLSPLGVFFRGEDPKFVRTWVDDLPWVATVGNFAAYGFVAVALRTILLRQADPWLRRP